MSSLKIQKLDPIEHILKRPDMYVGSLRTKINDEYVASLEEDGKMSIQRRAISFSPAILRIFVEALSNAIDNVQRSKEAGIPCTKIKVSINKETGETTIWNDGRIIEIEQEEGGVYKHTLIFGELRTSTNFNDEEERTVSGRNGLGIKLTNVFSKSFKVDAVDPVKCLRFSQQWSNNMKDVSKPKITKSSLKNGYTEVTWIPDFEHFKISGYSDDIINLYTRYVLDCAMLTKVNVYFNDNRLPVKSLQDYSKLFSSSTTESIFIQGKDSDVVVCSSAKDFEAISFVNGVFTINGGKHVDGWTEAVFRPIVDHFNKPSKPQITIKDVKQFYRIFVVSTLVNPEFSSQSKTELTSPDVDAKVDTKTSKSMLKWETISKINDVIRSKELLVLKKSESKKKGFTSIEGYEPANEAGGKNSLECTLALCEGLSAKTFAVKGMDSPLFGKSGRDWFGVYALRGKILNVRNANSKSIAENREITAIIQALGLRYGVDYTNDENFAQLNYGKLLVLTDADTDGKHIAGLIINLIHFLFPSLLERRNPSFLVDMSTPIAKFFMKGGTQIFYSLNKADEYLKSHINSNINIKIKYYKGLGSHSNEEIQEEFGKRVMSYVKDENADKNMLKAFHTKLSDERKQWIEQYDPSNFPEYDEVTKEKDISQFIDEDLITHSIDNCKRSIPSIMDGLKQSQRKIIYACFLKNLKTSLKVSQLSGYVAEKTNYHHGEQNLYDTITKMANEFVGSNNIPLLFRDGQFGSRMECGKDAANARYILTKLESITRYLFREEDDALLERVVDDGDIVEPVFYVPILPMILINGTEGIGTGWASSVPCYNPLEVVECVKTWIKTENAMSVSDGMTISSLPEINPWYRGFRGSIAESGTGKYTTHGVCDREDGKKNTVVISEIPVFTSIVSVKEKLDELTYGKDSVLKSYKNYSSADRPMFIIEEYPDGLVCTPDNLKLYSYISTNNMVMTDETGKIRKYDTIDEIVDNFCKMRLHYYTLRKNYLLKTKKNEMLILKNKKRFLEEVMEGGIVLNRKKETVINTELEERGYAKDDDTYGYLLRLPIKSFTEEKVEELNNTIEKLSKEIDVLRSTEEKTMWLNDIEEFVVKYNEWLKEMELADKKSERKRNITTASTKKRVVKKKV